jgi:hypothetical protein
MEDQIADARQVDDGLRKAFDRAAIVIHRCSITVSKGKRPIVRCTPTRENVNLAETWRFRGSHPL